MLNSWVTAQLWQFWGWEMYVHGGASTAPEIAQCCIKWGFGAVWGRPARVFSKEAEHGGGAAEAGLVPPADPCAREWPRLASGAGCLPRTVHDATQSSHQVPQDLAHRGVYSRLQSPCLFKAAPLDLWAGFFSHKCWRFLSVEFYVIPESTLSEID